MNNLIKINNFREKFSSHLNIFIPKDDNKYTFCEYLNNNKIINMNNFILRIKNKKIKYSTYYTNPFVLDKKIISKINLYSNINVNIKINNLNTIILNKFLIEKDKLTKNDKMYIETIISKKKFTSNYISLEETFLIMLYLIKYDENIKNKNYYFDLLNYYWLKFKLGEFEPNQIIDEFVDQIDLMGCLNKNLNSSHNSNYNLNSNSNNNIDLITDKIKFYICFYVLFEEFHFKYLIMWLNQNRMFYNQDNNELINRDDKNKFILNSNYVKINPQEILNNYRGQYYTNFSNLLELIEIPFGHNILFIFNYDKVYLYDSDEQDLYDFFKFTQLFNKVGFKLSNISNRNPIQIITDDANCLFYCLRFVQYIIDCNIKINLDNLKTSVLIYEKKIQSNPNNMFNWIKKIV
jgi:hypothetical protein